jgi:hypothetical protein
MLKPILTWPYFVILFLDEKFDSIMNIEPVILLLTFCCLLLTTMISSVIMSILVVSNQLSQYILKRVIRSVDVLTLCEPVSAFLSEGRKRIVMLLNVGGNELLLACLLILSHS